MLQVVNATISTAVSTGSTTYVTTGLTASITPKFATSKILVLFNGWVANTTTNTALYTIYKNGSNILGASGIGGLYSAGGSTYACIGANYLDSPATTSSTTYAIYYNTSSGVTYLSYNGATSTITLMEIAG